ncbi:unnamed protein product [Protopolystoma xenopodis]|uniref:Uncharacterized protein n=1 Tax=Protopolystoma xenopodis TaxID=117903 RepID=A0A3S5CDS3_9PLAT|nr:unnamed protein product [Protopolystoma xenopodis]
MVNCTGQGPQSSGFIPPPDVAHDPHAPAPLPSRPSIPMPHPIQPVAPPVVSVPMKSPTSIGRSPAGPRYPPPPTAPPLPPEIWVPAPLDQNYLVQEYLVFVPPTGRSPQSPAIWLAEKPHILCSLFLLFLGLLIRHQ